jgi:hypothetical protein
MEKNNQTTQIPEKDLSLKGLEMRQEKWEKEKWGKDVPQENEWVLVDLDKQQSEPVSNPVIPPETPPSPLSTPSA